jgi:hypothetical protein
MTWALAKLCKLFAIGMNLRNSLKILKGMSTVTTNSSITSDSHPSPPHLCMTTTGRSILMFWAIFALITIWEQYFERLFQWIPLYYYCKSLFILLMAFPKLKFTNNIFHQYLIPFFEWIHDHYEHITDYDWKEFLLKLPFVLLFLFFPFHLEVKYSSDRLPSSSSAQSALAEEDKDGDGGGKDYDLSIPLYGDEDDVEVTLLEAEETKEKIHKVGKTLIKQEKKTELMEFSIEKDDMKPTAKSTNPFEEEDQKILPQNITLRRKYVPFPDPSATPISKRPALSFSEVEESFTSPLPTQRSTYLRSSTSSDSESKRSVDRHELSAEKVSPMLNGFRQVLMCVSHFPHYFSSLCASVASDGRL